MADIVIRGMEMPSNCLDCKIRRDWLTCPILDRYVMNNKTDRHTDCPLGLLPEGHGRLIDADDALKKIPIPTEGASSIDIYNNIKYFIETCPTVVPTEGEY